MGFFSSNKKIYRDDFKRALRKISQLSPEERHYVEGVFNDSLKDGLSKYEIEKEISRLKHVSGDPLEPLEVKKIKEKLMGRF